MRRIVIALAGTVTALVMLFSWPSSTNRSVSSTTGGTSGTGTTGGTGSGPTSGSTTSGAGTTGTTGAPAGATTYDGAVASTRWGDVQVRITVTNGTLTASEAIAYQNGNGHDQQINAYAIPILNQAAVAAQSAKISMVSGATVTSQGYVQSLQSALDKAGI